MTLAVVSATKQIEIDSRGAIDASQLFRPEITAEVIGHQIDLF